jgi:glycosyltransferase involved in cell wall biosynthesis
MTEHDAYERVPSEHLTKMQVFSKFYLDKIYRCVTILTEADRKYIGNRLKNVVVMPNPSTFPPYQGELHKEKILLAAGRISNWHYKGFDLLIEAWGEIAEKYPDWKLELAGDGAKEDFSYLKRLAAKYGVTNRMEFLGYRSDMLNLYQKAAIYVLSSRSEGLPMVIIEAMGQGCACVAVENFGRTKEMITREEEGLLCEMENPKALSSIMEKMITDENYRKEVQLNSIARSEYYSLDHVIGLWEKLLSNIIKN